MNNAYHFSNDSPRHYIKFILGKVNEVFLYMYNDINLYNINIFNKLYKCIHILNF